MMQAKTILLSAVAGSLMVLAGCQSGSGSSNVPIENFYGTPLDRHEIGVKQHNEYLEVNLDSRDSIRGDGDFEIKQRTSAMIEYEGVGLSSGNAAENNSIGGLNRRVGDFRICDNHIRGGPIKINNNRLVHTELQIAGHACFAGL